MLRCTGGGRSGSSTAEQPAWPRVRSTFSTGRHGSWAPVAGEPVALGGRCSPETGRRRGPTRLRQIGDVLRVAQHFPNQVSRGTARRLDISFRLR
jgi:hypothetical protein